MPAEIKQDILYNFITNTAMAIEGFQRMTGGLDRLSDGMEKVERNTSFVNRALSTFTGVVLRDLGHALVRTATRAIDRLGNLFGMFVQHIADIEAIETRLKGIGEVIYQVFAPAIQTVAQMASDALGWIERLFKDPTGAWTEGFLRLRATVQVFANWLLSVWERLTANVGDRTENMLDRIVDAVVAATAAIAKALRAVATFMAGIFGGAVPGEVTAEGVAETRPTAREPIPLVTKPPPKPRKPPKPTKPPKEVEPPSAEDLARLIRLQEQWAAATAKLAEATAVAEKARAALEKAEERLEAASEKVYDIRRKIQRLELEWAEIPERFVRGRRKQLQLELQAAQHAEHERQEEAKGAREKFQEAEKYRREVESGAKKIKSEMDSLSKSIERQAERYADYLVRMQEWAASNAERLAEWRAEGEEAMKAWGELGALTAELDAATSAYIGEMEERLLPLFADIEASVISIGDSLKAAWETAKQWAADMLAKLAEIRQWWDGLPEWVKDIFRGVGIAVALNFITKGAVGQIIAGLIKGAFAAAGLIPGVGFVIAAGAIALLITLKPFLNPEVRQAWADVWTELTTPTEEGWLGMLKNVFLKGAEASEKTIEETPVLGNLLAWVDSWELPKAIEDLFRGAKDGVAGAAEEGVERPFTDVMERMSRNLVGESVIPDMVDAILNWIRKLADRLGEYLDQMAAKFRVLENSIRGLEPALADVRQFTSGGSIKVINITGPFNIGGGLTAMDVQRAIYDAIFNMLRE